MKKLIEKIIVRNIKKILLIYKNSIKHRGFNFNTREDRTVYFNIEFLLRDIENREEKLWKK